MAAMGEGGGRRLKRLKINGERESKGEKEGNAGKSIFVAESTRKRERKRERERERERAHTRQQQQKEEEEEESRLFPFEKIRRHARILERKRETEREWISLLSDD
jgi:hypothetical protein